MRILPAICITALLAGALPGQKATDTVLKKDGSRERGVEVTTFTLQGLQWKRGDKTGDVPAYHIKSVAWGDAPDAFVTARAAMDRSDYESAKQLFGEAINQTERPVLKTEARYWQCRAAVGTAGVDSSAAASAAGAIRALLSESPDSFRVPELLLLLGRALRHGGLGADAETALKDLDDRAGAEGWGTIWSARAKYEIALAQIDLDRPAEARLSFQAAGSSAQAALSNPSGDDSELQTLVSNAKVGEGETFVAEKDFGRAVDYFRGLATMQPELKAAAKAGEGQALYLQGTTEDRIDGVRKAQIALAEASVIDPGTGDTGAKANYFLGLCLLALGADREGDTFRNRAINYFQIVARSYASSRWAALAKVELAR